MSGAVWTWALLQFLGWTVAVFLAEAVCIWACWRNIERDPK